LLEGFARAAEGEEALSIEVWEYEYEDVEGQVGDGADGIGHFGVASGHLFGRVECKVGVSQRWCRCSKVK
jgi:hypothetical protein